MLFIKKRKIIVLFIVLVLLASFLVVSSLFPLKYWNEIEYYSGLYSLDPFLVAAIINVESNFDNEARSKKDARGLMQLMPVTADWIASQMHLDYDKEKLYHPEYNIHFGCWYLFNLKRNFDNKLPVVLAAYNGGRGNAKLWIDSGIWDGELESTENIPFSETENFIKKVNYNHRAYKLIYGNILFEKGYNLFNGGNNIEN